MVLKFDLIAAACENMGIGKNNDLPWRLRKEMDFFTRMTSETSNKDKKNIVLMGRRTWDSIPPKFKPLSDRLNFVLSRSKLDLTKYQNVYNFASLDEVVQKLKDPEFKNTYENVWVIGGSGIYQQTMESKHFHRLYLTKIMKDFDCDTFFPKLPDDLTEVVDSRVPDGVQEEKGIQFVYKVYEKTSNL